MFLIQCDVGYKVGRLRGLVIRNGLSLRFSRRASALQAKEELEMRALACLPIGPSGKVVAGPVTIKEET